MTNRLSLRFRTFLLVFFVLIPLSVSYAVRVERLVDTWRPTHYLINITLDDQLSEITSATARIDVLVLKPTALIDLDLGDLTVDAVRSEERRVGKECRS